MARQRIYAFNGQYTFLSNFYPCEIRHLGQTYRTLEHAYQASKVFNKWDHLRIAGLPTPAEAKKFGRTLCLRPDWTDDTKIEVMRLLIRKKFKAGTMLAEKLIATGDAILIEGNWWGDRFWGKCPAGPEGEGDNWLGKLLMRQRNRLNLQ